MVFQSFNLFAHLTIVENIMLAQTELLGRSRQEAYERSVSLLETVGLAGKAQNYPAELSGGQQNPLESMEPLSARILHGAVSEISYRAEDDRNIIEGILK